MMDFKDELYEVLNKYNLSRTAKEKITDIVDKEKEALLDILEREVKNNE